jgi:hypothetical protein
MSTNEATDSTSLAVAYYLNGANFRASAERLTEGLTLDRKGRPTSVAAVPLFFLASHAAELFLKAALLKRGVDASSLKAYDFRHNLGALLAALQRLDVPVTAETTALVAGLSRQHEKHQLRYTVMVDDGETTYWPPLANVFAALDELLMLTRVATHGV